MIEAYEQSYDLYFTDQMTKFESFEGELYKDGIRKTIDYVFDWYRYKHLSLLDFCCGDGTGAGMLSEMGFWVDGFDGNTAKLSAAIEKNPDLNFFYLDAREVSELLPIYDIVYASHCFEHFMDPIGILLDTKKLLLKDGIIILILPYPNEECEGHPGSTKLWLNEDIKTIKNKYKELGFEVLRIEEMNFREPELLIILQ
jgi:SAM-dependent methyltransferase